MFFTQEDYRKIEKWLSANSVKDTEFAGAATPLKGNETIAFVQDGRNVNVFLNDLVEQIFLLGVSDFLNVTDKYNESYISLTQAIQLIPFRSRKIGQVITFLDDSNNWRIYQFQGQSINQWNNTTLWINLIESIQDLGLIDSEDIITKTNIANKTSLLFADKNYNTADYSGLGRIYLRKNIQRVQNPNTGVFYNTNLLTQQMMTKENTIYILQYDYSLNGQTVSVPDGCIVVFEGGSVNDGTVTFNNTRVIQQDIENYITATIDGSYKEGQILYDSVLKKMKLWNGTAWVGADGYKALVHKGETVSRPTLTTDDLGFQYYDTTLNKYICWNGTAWVNMDGTPLT